jgi:hypothetical protein
MLDQLGPHAEVPQNEQLRVAVPGRRVPDGLPSTLIVICSPERNAWCFYIDSDPGQQIAVRVDQVGPLVELLNGNGDA